VAGNPLAAPFQWGFTTAVAPDAIPPAISAALPTGSCAATEATLYVTFSEAVQVNTVDTGTFLLRDSSNTPSQEAQALITWGGDISIRTVLLKCAAYTGTLTTGIMDPAGNHLSADYSWTFTTQAAGTVSGVPPPSPERRRQGFSTPLSGPARK